MREVISGSCLQMAPLQLQRNNGDGMPEGVTLLKIIFGSQVRVATLILEILLQPILVLIHFFSLHGNYRLAAQGQLKHNFPKEDASVKHLALLFPCRRHNVS